MSDNIKALIALGIFTFMSTLDGSIVNIALPEMSRELNVSTSQITWVVIVYLIAISAFLLFFGRLGDLIGKSKIARLGWIIFILGSALTGLDFGWGLNFLLFARVIQAIGSAMFMATVFGIISEIFPSESRARALSISAMFVSVGSIAGPALGGVILQVASWNYIFWINVPIGILAWIFGSKSLPIDTESGSWKNIDFKGGILMMVAIILISLSLNCGQSVGWTNPLILISSSLGFIIFIIFIITEKKVSMPLLDLRIFKSKVFSISILISIINFTVAMFSSILLPFYLQDYKNYSPGVAGLMMVAYPVGMLIASPFSGVAADKMDKEIVTFIGISGIVLSQLGYLLINGQSGVMEIGIILFIQGIAMGIFQSPNNATIMENVDHKFLGIAGSINSLARNIAFVLGTSLATLILFTTMSNEVGHRVTTYLVKQPDAFLKGFHVAFYFSSFLSLISWLVGLIGLLVRGKYYFAKRTEK